MEDYSSEDEERVQDERTHNRLLSAISGLDGKKRDKKILQRTEFTEVSEYHVPCNELGVDIDELLGALSSKSKSKSTLKIQKMLKPVQDEDRILDTPLSVPEKQRTERAVGYRKVNDELKKWNPVVDSNRKAETMRFPLIQPTLQVKDSSQFVKKFTAFTDLEKQVEEALNSGRKFLIPKEKLLSEAEIKAMEAFSVEEAKERRAELQKYRVLLSYKQAKACQQKKIKSKKYRRILKKERERNSEKALDELKRTDPEAYKETIDEAMRQRAEERMSLKHKGTSKAMKKRALYSKYDETSRQQIADMKEKAVELMTKPATEEQTDEEDDDDEEDDAPVNSTSLQNELMPEDTHNNPWMSLRSRSVKSAPEPVVIDDDEEEEADTMEGVATAEDDDVIASEVTPESEKQSPKKMNNKKRALADTEDTVQQRPGKRPLTTESANSSNKKQKGDEVNVEQAKRDVANSNKKKKKNKSVGKSLTPKMVSLPEEETTQEEDKKDFSGKSIDEIFRIIEKKQILSKPKKELTEADRRILKRDAHQAEDDARIVALRHKKRGAASAAGDNSSDEEDADAFKPAKKSQREANVQSTQRCQTEEDLEQLSTIADDGKAADTTSKQVASGDKAPTKAPTSTTATTAAPVKTIVLNTAHPVITEEEEDGGAVEETAIDAEERRRMTIAEAFEDDDVIDTFREEKQSLEKVKAIDLSLPGWGAWGGKGVKITKNQRRRNKRFIIKPKDLPRKDRDLDHVIISETKDKSASVHQVNRLPFPYDNRAQFEASVRQPIGATWQPQTAVRVLTKPTVLIRSGTIIEPIDKSVVFNKNLSVRKSFASKYRQREKEGIPVE